MKINYEDVWVMCKSHPNEHQKGYILALLHCKKVTVKQYNTLLGVIEEYAGGS